VSVYLEAVAQAAEHRRDAEQTFRAALVQAANHHSLSQIAPYAGMKKSGVAYLVKTERNNES
jgi:hypothetical protein